MTAHWSDVLVRMGASDFVARWARTQPDLATAWAACPEVDWMLWVVEHTDRDPRHVAIWLCACAMVDRVLVHVPSGEERPHNAVEARRAWCRGEVSDQGLLRAHRDALDSYPRTAYAAEASRAAAARAVEAAAAVAYPYYRSYLSASARAAEAVADADRATNPIYYPGSRYVAYDAERRVQLRLIREMVPMPSLEVIS